MPQMVPMSVPVQPKAERESSRERIAMWESLKKSAKHIPSLRGFVEEHAE